MKVIMHDLSADYNVFFEEKSDEVIYADGKYVPCQGCLNCWTKHPAECFMKDSMQYISRVIGRADELIIVSKNFYGSYSAPIKTILDRSIGISTPLSTFRGGQMHHTLRYGLHNLLKVLVYGEISEKEKSTFKYLAERNAINDGYKMSEVYFIEELTEMENLL